MCMYICTVCRCIFRSSGPSDPAERAKLEDFAQQVAAAKSKAQAQAKSKTKKVKEYDGSKLTVLEPQFRQMGIDAKERATKMIEKAQNVLKFFCDDATLAQTYTSGIATLAFRLLTLQKLMEDNDSEKTQDEAAKAFLSWQEEPLIARKITDGVKSSEPHAKVKELKTFRELDLELGLVVKNIDSLETEKSEKKRIKALVDLTLTMVTRVSEQTSRLATCGKSFQDKTQKAAEKKDEEERNEAGKKVKQEGAIARMANQAGKAPITFAIFNSISAFRAIASVTERTVDQSNNMPYVVKSPMDPDLVQKQLQSEEFTKFIELAEKNTRYLQSGRVAQQLSSHPPPVLKYISDFLNPGRQDVLKHLSDAEKAYVSTPWMFLNSGRMKSRGVEFSYLPSMKYQLTGSRVVLVACYSELTEFYKSTIAPTATVTYDNVMDLFAAVPKQKQQ